MQIQAYSDSELLLKTRDLSTREHALALQLVEHRLEIDARKLFAQLGYDSLFRYIVKELGFSEAVAYERLRAMRLVRRVPEAREKLETGALTLTTAAQVESFRKQENLSQTDTVALLEEAAHKSKREVEGLLLSKSPEGALPKEKIRRVTETLKEAKIILDPKLQRLLERYEELHGKQHISEILTDLLEAHLQKADPLRRAIATTKRRIKKAHPEKVAPQPQTQSDHNPQNSERPQSPEPHLHLKPPIPPPSRYISASTGDFIWKRSHGVCEWVDLKSGKRCSSRYRLQFDHYPIPFARGGPSTPENLRHTCAAHNARFAVEVFGKEAGDFRWSGDSKWPTPRSSLPTQPA